MRHRTGSLLLAAVIAMALPAALASAHNSPSPAVEEAARPAVETLPAPTHELQHTVMPELDGLLALPDSAALRSVADRSSPISNSALVDSIAAVLTSRTTWAARHVRSREFAYHDSLSSRHASVRVRFVMPHGSPAAWLAALSRRSL